MITHSLYSVSDVWGSGSRSALAWTLVLGWPSDSSFCALVCCMSSCIFSAVVFQDVAEIICRIFSVVCLWSSGVVSNASSQALINAWGVAAMATTSPYRSTTSVIGVLTTGSSAAMYSRVLVGLM